MANHCNKIYFLLTIITVNLMSISAIQSRDINEITCQIYVMDLPCFDFGKVHLRLTGQTVILKI
jgi:hypothetical protein